MSLQELRKLTRREISSLITAMLSRKQGYPDAESNDKIKTTDEIKERIRKAHLKRFGEDVPFGKE
jgi:hypothetical protein